jgi:hypothetical protein
MSRFGRTRHALGALAVLAAMAATAAPASATAHRAHRADRTLVMSTSARSPFGANFHTRLVGSGKKALINADSVTANDGITEGGVPISLEQFAAQRLGYTVTVVSGATWDSMSASQFASYDLIVIGDPFCGPTPDSAISNAGTWAPVVMGKGGGRTIVGNRVLISTDPEFHYAAGGGGAPPTNASDPTTAGAEHLVQDGMAFAGAQSGATDLYFDTSCADPGGGTQGAGDIAVLDMLTTTGAGHWTENASPPCGGSVQKIAATAAFATLKDSDIQGWECSDHETWPAFPADWNAEAVATDTPSHPTCGTDPDTGTTACGEAYVLIAGSGIVSTAPNISVSPTTATNPVGTRHTLTATVTQSGGPVSGAVVTFAIGSGPNAGVSGTCSLSGGGADPTCATGADGKVRFTYTGAGGVGTDTIDASVTLSGTTEHATATKTWVSARTVTTVSAQGFRCEVTVGTGSNGSVLHIYGGRKDPLFGHNQLRG